MKIEFDDLYKFLVSIGLGLIISSVVIPWIILREPYDLLVNQVTYDTLLEKSKEIINYRLDILLYSTKTIMSIFALLFIGGLLLVGIGVYKWYKNKQRILDRHYSNYLFTIQEQFTNKSKREVEKEKKLELLDQQKEPPYVIRTSNNISKANKEVYKRSVMNEKLLINNINNTFVETHEVQINKKYNDVMLDLLLFGKQVNIPSYVIEVKYIYKGYRADWLIEVALRTLYSAKILFTELKLWEIKPIIIIIGPRNIILSKEQLNIFSRVKESLMNNKQNVQIINVPEEEINTIDIRKAIN